jgi:hypothetical protein
MVGYGVCPADLELDPQPPRVVAPLEKHIGPRSVAQQLF